jgi:hypothetical protein
MAMGDTYTTEDFVKAMKGMPLCAYPVGARMGTETFTAPERGLDCQLDAGLTAGPVPPVSEPQP